MKSKPLAIETVNTSCGIQYNVTDKDGTIYATTYDKVAAGICCDALNKLYLIVE